MHEPSPTTPRLSATPDRRTVLRGAAWTAPALVAASAAPAFASSTPLPWITVSFLDVGERFHGGHTLAFRCLVTNASSIPVPGPITLTLQIPDHNVLGDFSTDAGGWVLEWSSEEYPEVTPVVATARNTTDLAPYSSATFNVLFPRAEGQPFRLEATVAGSSPAAVHTNVLETWGGGVE